MAKKKVEAERGPTPGCRVCGDIDCYRCGPDHNYYFLCDEHREDFKTRLRLKAEKQERDYLQDLADRGMR